jgi:hypothetical protein
MFGGHSDELLTIGVAAVYFVKPSWRIARPADNRRAREHIVHERSRLSAVKQAGARFGS